MQKIVEVQKSTISSYQLFDFGKAAYGTLEVELSADFDHLVEVVIGESCANGTILHEHGWRTFILNRINIRKGTHTYRFEIPDFIPAYSVYPYLATPLECGGEIAPFRYVEINHYYGEATVRRTVWHDDWNDSASHFESSDPELNKIWEFCKYSIKATNAFECYIDGERERLPYEGDAYINQLGWFCCCTDGNIPRRTLEYLFHCHTWPYEWFLLMPQMVKDYLLYTGDTDFLPEALPHLEKCLLYDYLDDDGLLETKENSNIRVIVDWPPAERDDYEFGKTDLVPNCYRYRALQVMAELTGDDKYLIEAEKIKKLLRSKMMKNGIFVDSSDSSHTSLHTSVFALLARIGNIAECPLIEEKGMACSVYASQFLLDVCFQNGMEQYAKNLLVSKDIRSWYNMIAKGATISMEAWDDSFKPNQDWNHAWGAAPANIIPRQIGGIRPVEYGFRSFIFDPHAADLQYFYLKHPTPFGAIKVNYSCGIADLTVPEGTKAFFKGTVLMPGKHRIHLKG